MDEKKKQELAGLLGMIGTGALGVGTLAGGGSLISNYRGANRAIDDLYQRRVLDQARKFTVASLNSQQKAAVKRLTGRAFSEFVPEMPVTELPVNINGRQYTLGEIMYNPDVGVKSKLTKGADALRMREAINQLVVPIQQTVLSQAQDKVARRQTIRNVASQHVAEGGLMPQVTNMGGQHGINMIGQGTSASAIRQGALGSTAPTSSLITNEGFSEGPRMSFNEIAQRLPINHPSVAPQVNPQTGTRQRSFQQQSSPFPPVTPEETVAKVPTKPMSTQSSNFIGPETLPEREAAYRQAYRELNPTGLAKLKPKVVVPGTGRQVVKTVARNIARGAVRAPLASKLGAGAVVAGGIIKHQADNYTADKIVEDVVKQAGPPTQSAGDKTTTKVQGGIAPPDENTRQILDMFDARYAHLSKAEKVAEAKKMASQRGSYTATAQLWLKYNAPNQ